MNILTFDLEDWFHIIDHAEIDSPSKWDKMESRVERNTERILNLLEEKKIKATWFSLGWIAKKYPGLIKRISQNHELACHSMEHRLLFRQNKETARKDIVENKKLLEDLTGKKVIAYRAPGFSFTTETKWLTEILISEGFVYDCSIFPAERNNGGYINFPYAEPCRIVSGNFELREFPMNTASLAGKRFVFSGGGYFRLLPYSVISSLMKKSGYVMSYFHPRDFDFEQPMIKSLPLKRKFMSYVGLKKSFVKLNRLLNDFTFISLEEAGRLVDWEKTPKFNLNDSDEKNI